MSEALLVTGREWRFPGYEHRFAVASSRMRSFLLRKGLGPVHALSPDQVYSSEDALGSIRNFLDRESHEYPALITFNGHGNQEGWGLDENVQIPYPKLLRVLLESPVPVIVVNDCCNAGALMEQAMAVQPSCLAQVLIMCVCPADKLAFGGFVGTVIHAWREGRPFIPQERIVEMIRIGNPEMEASGIPMSEVCDDGVIRINWIPSKAVKIGEYSEPPEELRWGASLDHHLYTKRI